MAEPDDGSRDAPGAPGLIRAERAAHLLDGPPSWVLAEARADRIPHVRLRYVRFGPDELRAWWQARARGPQHRAR